MGNAFRRFRRKKPCHQLAYRPPLNVEEKVESRYPDPSPVSELPGDPAASSDLQIYDTLPKEIDADQDRRGDWFYCNSAYGSMSNTQDFDRRRHQSFEPRNGSSDRKIYEALRELGDGRSNIRNAARYRDPSFESPDASSDQEIYENIGEVNDVYRHEMYEDLMSTRTSATMIHGINVLQSAGTYEVELNWEGESELHKLKKHCQKHPGHDKFIPSHEFDEQHLPAHYKHKLIVDLVRCLSTLTVRLTVDKISASRPHPPYPPTPRCDNLGRDCSINGTGHVSSAVVCPEGADNCCACSKCQESGNPARRFGKIFIQTAAHVVHDDNEAANTTCYFNYVNDSDGLDTAIKIQGAKGVQIDAKEDRCWMFCYTDDLSLVNKLDSMVHMYQRLRREVADKYCVNWADTPEDKLTIIVSHPHGCSKYVTVGNMEGRLAAEDDADWTQYTYTTPTCPGSSGAPIFMLGKHGYIDNHHHSGTVPDTGLNVSTFGLF